MLLSSSLAHHQAGNTISPDKDSHAVTSGNAGIAHRLARNEETSVPTAPILPTVPTVLVVPAAARWVGDADLTTADTESASLQSVPVLHSTASIEEERSSENLRTDSSATGSTDFHGVFSNSFGDSHQGQGQQSPRFDSSYTATSEEKDHGTAFLPKIYARMGPTHDDQLPFCWSAFEARKSKTNKRGKKFVHVGQPDCFDFNWQQFPPRD